MLEGGAVASQVGAVDGAREHPPARALQVSLAWRRFCLALGLVTFFCALTALELRTLRWADPILLWGRTGDPVFNLYVLKWSAHQLGLGLPDLWNANFFFPAKGTLAFSDHLLGPALQMLVLGRLGILANSISVYNLLLATSFALSVVVTSWVLRQSGCSWMAAVVGGAMYAFAPFRWAHLEHIQILLVQWAPLTLWLWHRLLTDPTWKRAWAFLAVYVLHLLGGSY